MTHDIDWVGYIRDELSPAEKAAADKHLELCSACRSDLARIRQLGDLGRRAYRHAGSDPTHPCPTDEDLIHDAMGLTTTDVHRALVRHVGQCARCRAKYDAALDLDDDLEEETEAESLPPLPPRVVAALAASPVSLMARLRSKIEGLRRQGGEELAGLLDELQTFTRQLSEWRPRAEPAVAAGYAWDRDVADMPGPSIQVPSTGDFGPLEIDLPPYRIRVRQDAGRIQIALLRDGIPATAVPFRATTADGTVHDLETDTEGRAFL